MLVFQIRMKRKERGEKVGGRKRRRLGWREAGDMTSPPRVSFHIVSMASLFFFSFVSRSVPFRRMLGYKRTTRSEEL
jgi:hypothetical protein